MNHTIHLFSVLADRLGARTLEIHVSGPVRASELLDELALQYEVIAELRGVVRLAVNREYADEDLTIRDGDELALITPTSGG